MQKYIMALDAGTNSNRCILFDGKGEICSMAQREFAQIFPKPGWVEHNALEIWETMHSTAIEAMSKVNARAEDIAAIGITNQRETAVVWDKETGDPVCNAIVWQCRRMAEYCDQLKTKELTKSIRDKTGLVIDAYFSGTKIRWILENIPGARERAEKGELLFGTVETWLIWKLTQGRIHVTDYSNASRTMLFNINSLQWDDEILAELNIPKCMLPEAKPSSGIYGYTDPALLGISICVVLCLAGLLPQKTDHQMSLPQPKASKNTATEAFERKDYTSTQMLCRPSFWMAFVSISFLAAVDSLVISFAKIWPFR